MFTNAPGSINANNGVSSDVTIDTNDQGLVEKKPDTDTESLSKPPSSNFKPMGISVEEQIRLYRQEKANRVEPPSENTIREKLASGDAEGARKDLVAIHESLDPETLESLTKMVASNIPDPNNEFTSPKDIALDAIKLSFSQGNDDAVTEIYNKDVSQRLPDQDQKDIAAYIYVRQTLNNNMNDNVCAKLNSATSALQDNMLIFHGAVQIKSVHDNEFAENNLDPTLHNAKNKYADTEYQLWRSQTICDNVASAVMLEFMGHQACQDAYDNITDKQEALKASNGNADISNVGTRQLPDNVTADLLTKGDNAGLTQEFNAWAAANEDGVMQIKYAHSEYPHTFALIKHANEQSNEPKFLMMQGYEGLYTSDEFLFPTQEIEPLHARSKELCEPVQKSIDSLGGGQFLSKEEVKTKVIDVLQDNLASDVLAQADQEAINHFNDHKMEFTTKEKEALSTQMTKQQREELSTISGHHYGPREKLAIDRIGVITQTGPNANAQPLVEMTQQQLVDNAPKLATITDGN